MTFATQALTCSASKTSKPVHPNLGLGSFRSEDSCPGSGFKGGQWEVEHGMLVCSQNTVGAALTLSGHCGETAPRPAGAGQVAGPDEAS